MKKFVYYAFAMMTTLFTLTSCDTDQQIANYLINGNWKGDLNTYYRNRWGEEWLDGEYYTVWRFEPGVYDDWGYVTSGYGTEADYNKYDDREFAYSSFRWEVRNGNIYIYYDDPTWNNVRIDWRDYSISSSRFRGTMYDWEDRAYDFDLDNVGYWNWNHYRARAATRGEGDDSTYVSDNGSSVATGRFAKALKKMASEK
jgi:hypothetical protein